MATFKQAADQATLVLTDPGNVRYTLATLFGYGLDAIREIAVARPDLFMVTAPVACTPGTVLQDIPINGLYLLAIHGVVDGPAILEADLDTIKRYQPSWMTDEAGPAEDWFPISIDTTKRPQTQFYIYPKAPNSQSLLCQYVLDPLYGNAFTIDSAMPIPDILMSAVWNYMVYRAESIDDEHVLTQRAAQCYTTFANIVSIEEKNRKTIVIEGNPQ